MSRKNAPQLDDRFAQSLIELPRTNKFLLMGKKANFDVVGKKQIIPRKTILASSLEACPESADAI
jgi:hypothetical protein